VSKKATNLATVRTKQQEGERMKRMKRGKSRTAGRVTKEVTK
jgi:hypothetical protein